ncbi:MAG: SDR family NAD(P)-dependent oxidoreductase [Spirochaetia bacterium]
MIDFKKKTALVTGASSGIGEAFAETLAARGANVILVARSKGKLDRLAARIRKARKASADVIVADLSQENAPDKVYSAVRKLGRDVDILVNNAGFGTHGPFHALSARDEHEEIMLNVAALVGLTHLFLPGMLARRGGIVVNVASTAAFQPVPYMAVYGATKAFVLSFSEALWAEYRGVGVRVLALCPGPTETNFFKVAGESVVVGKKRAVASVIATALTALERGKSSVIDGRLNYLMAQSVRLSPRGLLAGVAGRVLKPKDAEKKGR